MTTLFDASLALAKILGNVRSSTTTAAGSATTVVDSTRTEAADYFNDGTIWITSGTDANKSRKITDWALSGTTFTVPTLTSAPGSGATYSVISGDWPRDKLWEWINSALRDIGDIMNYDTSTTTVEDQESYTLPAGVYDVRRVEIANETSSPYDYYIHYGWQELYGKIWFDSQAIPDTTGYIVRLWYPDQHAVMDDDTDTIDNQIHLDRLIWTAAVHAWRWRMQLSKEDEPMYAMMYQEALAQSAITKAKHPIYLIPKDPRHTTWLLP